MAEDCIDISGNTSDNVSQYAGIDFDYIITVCDNAKERCPYFPSKARRFHYNFPDPAKASGTEEQIMDSFRSARDMIREYCKEFIDKHLK